MKVTKENISEVSNSLKDLSTILGMVNCEPDCYKCNVIQELVNYVENYADHFKSWNLTQKKT